MEYPLNINTATAEELATIDGITDKIAQLIVLYRERGGAYETKEELKLIKQISISLYNEIEDKLICE
ncbi:MAG: ComEA family DNA-binding protein [Oscillospiraceae bacterium]